MRRLCFNHVPCFAHLSQSLTVWYTSSGMLARNSPHALCHTCVAVQSEQLSADDVKYTVSIVAETVVSLFAVLRPSVLSV